MHVFILMYCWLINQNHNVGRREHGRNGMGSSQPLWPVVIAIYVALEMYNALHETSALRTLGWIVSS